MKKVILSHFLRAANGGIPSQNLLFYAKATSTTTSGDVVDGSGSGPVDIIGESITDTSGNGNDISVFGYCGKFGGGANIALPAGKIFSGAFKIEFDIYNYQTVAALRIVMAGAASGNDAVYINNGKFSIRAGGTTTGFASAFSLNGTITISRTVEGAWTITDGTLTETKSWTNSGNNFQIDRLGWTALSVPADMPQVRFYDDGSTLSNRWVIQNYFQSPALYIYDDVGGGTASLFQNPNSDTGAHIDFYTGKCPGSYLFANGFEAKGNIAIPATVANPAVSVAGGTVTNTAGTIANAPIFLNFAAAMAEHDLDDILFDVSDDPRDITPTDMAGWGENGASGQYFYSATNNAIMCYSVEQISALSKIKSYLKLPYTGSGLLFEYAPASADFVDTTIVPAQWMHYQTSAFASVNYTTLAEKIQVVAHNDFYDGFPTLTAIGIYVDGVYHSSFAPSAQGSSASAVISLPAGSKTLSIVNGPQSRALATVSATGTFIGGILSDKQMTVTTPSATGRILVYGDSIAVGQAADPVMQKAWVLQVRAAAHPTSVALEGWGWRSLYFDAADPTKRGVLVATLAGYSPAKIWLAIGTNDYGLNYWNATDFGAAYAALLDDLNTALPAATIYCQTPLLRTTETANGKGSTLGDYRTEIATAVSTRGAFCTLVDGTAIMTTASLSDATHPTTAGHDLYAAAVIAELGL